MAEEKTEEKARKENSDLVALTSSAIPINFEDFCNILKILGGQLEFDNEYQEHENGPFFHALRYNGDLYITKTDDFIRDFLV